MNKYYVSLCRSMIGYYIVFEADNEDIVRSHLLSYYGEIWCSVYTEKPKSDYFNMKIINEDNPIKLDDSDWE